MENETIVVQDSFTKVLVKAFAINASATAGMVGGLCLIGAVANWAKNKTAQTKTA